MRASRQIVLAIALVVTIPALMLFFVTWLQEYSRRIPFDSVVWRTQIENIGDDTRIRMLDDLFRQVEFLGMPRAQVTDILGEPRKTEYFSEYDLVYWLGPQRGFMGIDSEWLVFRLNEDKKVAEYRIVTD
jgi:hypothetical protein